MAHVIDADCRVIYPGYSIVVSIGRHRQLRPTPRQLGGTLNQRILLQIPEMHARTIANCCKRPKLAEYGRLLSYIVRVQTITGL